MELLLMGFLLAGAMLLGAARPMAKVTLYRVEETPRTDGWWE